MILLQQYTVRLNIVYNVENMCMFVYIKNWWYYYNNTQYA